MNMTLVATEHLEELEASAKELKELKATTQPFILIINNYDTVHGDIVLGDQS